MRRWTGTTWRRAQCVGAAAFLSAGVLATPPSVAAATSPDAVIAALADVGAPHRTIRGVAPSDRAGGYVAKILQPSVVRKAPRRSATRIGVARSRTSYLDQGTQLLVHAARFDAQGRPWLRVQLPIRPNGTTGWVPADDAVVRRNPWSVHVQLERRRLTVYRDGAAVRRVDVVVGAPDTPTPRGRFAIYEVAPQRDRRGFTGPWALNLTGFSTVLESFGSGPGRVAIHGRGPESLSDPLGSARSHGCVRVDNATIEWLQRRLTNGVPVRITLR